MFSCLSVQQNFVMKMLLHWLGIILLLFYILRPVRVKGCSDFDS